jgi:hypothetical protein
MSAKKSMPLRQTVTIRAMPASGASVMVDFQIPLKPLVVVVPPRLAQKAPGEGGLPGVRYLPLTYLPAPKTPPKPPLQAVKRTLPKRQHFGHFP